jgi:acyl-CoA synthetase (AMP-forming)/AMP-acid ligase II
VSVFDLLFTDIDRTDLSRIALIDVPGGARTTYRELIERVNATAGALAARGVGAGDVVGLLAPNSSLFAVAFHGILRAGATATTINALFTAQDVAKQLTDANATMLITVSALLPQAQEAARTAGIAPANLIVLDGDGETASGHPNADDLLSQDAPGTTGRLRSRHAPGGASLQLQNHRPPQGRHAHPPEPGGRRGADPAAAWRWGPATRSSRCCCSSTSTA